MLFSDNRKLPSKLDSVSNYCDIGLDICYLVFEVSGNMVGRVKVNEVAAVRPLKPAKYPYASGSSINRNRCCFRPVSFQIAVSICLRNEGSRRRKCLWMIAPDVWGAQLSIALRAHTDPYS